MFEKSPINCDTHFAEKLFQTCFKKSIRL
ncbi:MAG: DUF6783 domain-containing protein [Blautia faecis]